MTVGAAWLTSRAIKLVLEEEVYPRVELPRGVPYAVTSIVHYVLMFIGVLFAVSALGIDLTGFTVLSGAFGVGLGLGLQSVVNNFVSGLILLFERPVKLGDMVQLDDLNGRIDRIGIRATVLRLGIGAEVIVPNGKLLSDRLTNWTFSSRLRRIDVDFTTELGADPEVIRRMMIEQATGTDGLVARPAPQALLTRLGPDALGFNLQVWTEEAVRWPRIQSELLLGLNRRLREMGVKPK
jgi:potassium efflux system protein